MATKTGLTIDDFERLPADAVKHRELVDGELIDVSGNTPFHNIVRDCLMWHLIAWVRVSGAGRVIAEQEYDFEGNAHGPDVSFFGAEKQLLLDLHKRVQHFVPDLAVEVASANDTYISLLRKKDRYRRAGTTEVWLISAENAEIAIYRPVQDRILHSGHTITSDLLPGFSLAVDELFRGLQALPDPEVALWDNGVLGQPPTTWTANSFGISLSLRISTTARVLWPIVCWK